MRGLTGLAWRSLRARPLRTALTTVGIALGVAVLFAGLATNAAIGDAADRAARDRLGRADLRVAAFSGSGLAPETVAAVRATAGIAIAAPALERRTYLGATDGSSGLRPSVTVLGVDPDVEPRLHDRRLTQGRPLAGSTEPAALVSARLAADDGLSVGSTLTVLGAGEPARYQVIGVLAPGDPADDAGRTVVVPLRTAQAVFDDPGVTRIDVGLASGTDPTAVVRDLEARLLAEPYTVASAGDLAAGLRASTSDFAAMTALVSAIALFTGAFLILNTLSMTVSERVREVGLLRAAGATRGQVRRYVLTQALAVGLLGSLLGLALGAVLAVGIQADLGTVGAVTLDGVGSPAAIAIVAVLVGTAVTLAAAVEPARRAAAIPPVEALKARPETPAARGARLRWLALVLGVVAVAGLLLWPWVGGSSGSAGVGRAVAVYGILLIATLLIPWLVPTLARLGGLPFRLPLRIEERLARATLVRDRGRAALTIGALVVGLALVVALGGVAGAARAAADGWIQGVVPGDVLVTSIRPIAEDEGAAEDLRSVDDVARVSPIATFQMAVDGSATDAAAMVGSDLAADGRLDIIAGDRGSALGALDGGGVAIVPRSVAERRGLAVGDTLAVTADDGSALPLRVAAIAERTLPGTSGEAILVGWVDATSRLGVTGADAYAVGLAPGAPATTLDSLRAAAALRALEVVPLDRVQGAIDTALERIFGLLDALAIVAVIVAALGIANTLTMDVVERVREIGILRAAGMTRRQVWRSVVVEAGVVGVAGAVAGIVTGLVIGAVMVLFAGGRLDPASAVSWPTIGLAAILGVALAMLAAAWPARLAARISIPSAVAYE